MSQYVRPPGKKIGLKALIKALNLLKDGRFKEKTLAANLGLLEDTQYIVAGFGSDSAEYDLQIIEAKHALQRAILTQLEELDYRELSLEPIWKHFLFANALCYSDMGGSQERKNWRGLGVADKTKDHISAVLIERTQRILEGTESDDHDQAAEYACQILWGITSRYNAAHERHGEVSALLHLYDSSKSHKSKAL